MIASPELQLPLSEAEQAELASFLASERVEKEAMTLPMLDGFLTALLSGPNHVLQSVWLPLVWGKDSETDESPFSSHEEKQRIVTLILRHGNTVLHTLKDGKCSPLYEMAEPSEQKAQAREWSTGYVCGMWCDKESWLPILENEEGAQFLIPMLVPAAPEDFFEEQPTEEDVEGAISLMSIAAVGVFLYWQMGKMLPNFQQN